MQLLGEELDIFIMYVENLVSEFVKRLDIVDLLPDEVRGIVVDAQIRGGQQSRKRVRQIAGVVIRFCPPGHWSSPKSMGQFSMAILTPSSSASARIGGQTFLDELADSPPRIFVWSAADKRRNHVYAELMSAGADHVFQVRDDVNLRAFPDYRSSVLG